MRWLRKVSTPFRRVWTAIFAKLRPRKYKRGSGMGKLYNDVVSCGYEDVHVMWSMLHQTHAPVESPKEQHRPTEDYYSLAGNVQAAAAASAAVVKAPIMKS